MICVVENIRDVIAIESTQQFNGIYHVLGGIILPPGNGLAIPALIGNAMTGLANVLLNYLDKYQQKCCKVRCVISNKVANKKISIGS